MDILFYNGAIYSVDSQNTKYTALGVQDGRIVFLGNDEDASKIEAEKKVNLEGKTMIPGFIDSHLHMLNYAFVNSSYAMFDADSVDNIIENGKKLLKEIEANDYGQWLYGRGWNELNFSGEKRVLTRFDLDKISTTRPILFIRVCGHFATVNTRALEIILGLESTKDYLHQIDVENGILTEASVKLCYNVMTEPTVEQIKDYIMYSQKCINQCGITSVQTDNFLSLPGRNSERIMEAYHQLEEEGNMTLRVYEQASFTAFEDLKAFIDRGYRTGQGSDIYRIGPVKLYQDGSLGAKTALLNEPYLGSNDNYGVAVHDAEDLQNCVDYSYKNDMQIIVHAIGDRASDMVCAAYEKAIEKYGRKKLRLAINHLQIVSPDLFDRMKNNDILGFIQPIFVGGDRALVHSLIGEERSKLSYMWKTMMKKGIVCCGGSDSPVESFDPLQGIQLAVTRDGLDENTDGWHPEEKLSIEEAVRLFTINNAYGSFEENIKGSLEIGKYADMVVLSEDIFEADPHEIHKIKVLKTYVDGKEVYSA